MHLIVLVRRRDETFELVYFLGSTICVRDVRDVLFLLVRCMENGVQDRISWRFSEM